MSRGIGPARSTTASRKAAPIPFPSLPHGIGRKCRHPSIFTFVPILVRPKNAWRLKEFTRNLRTCVNSAAEAPIEAPFVDVEKWQEWRDSNPRPSVLETDALPTELHSCGRLRL